MKEDSLFLQEALGHVDPELLEESEAAPGKKRRPAPVRALMAAACICALLVAGVVAAEYTGAWVGDLSFPGKFVSIDEDGNMTDMFEPDRAGFSVLVQDNFDWSKTSKEFRDTVAAEPEDHYQVEFDSLAELEEFMGYTFPVDPLLEEEWCDELLVYKEEDGQPREFEVRIRYRVNDPNHAYHKIYYPLSEEQRERGVTESYSECFGPEIYLNVYGRGKGTPGFYASWALDEESELVREDYVTPGGLETVIFRETCEGHISYWGTATLEEVTVVIHGYEKSCINMEETIKSILDAFE